MTSDVRPDASITSREIRITERIAEDMRVKGRTADEALGNIADAVRYTFQYPADQYTDAVRAHIERMWRAGLAELTVRNCWACETWKGISTSWQDPRTGQVFEVQFHTPESLAARELTYPAYRRLRGAGATDAERAEIMAQLRGVYAGAPARHAPAAERERARPAAAPGTRLGRGVRVTHYSITDRYSSEDSPAGVLRRVEHPGGQRDEAFGRDLRWRHTFLLYSWERGNLDNTLREISADGAMRITDRIRREVTFLSNSVNTPQINSAGNSIILQQCGNRK